MYKSQQNHEFIAHMHGLVLISQESIAARMKNLRKIADFFIRNRVQINDNQRMTSKTSQCNTDKPQTT